MNNAHNTHHTTHTTHLTQTDIHTGAAPHSILVLYSCTCTYLTELSSATCQTQIVVFSVGQQPGLDDRC
jgi:hypothetical protein